MTTLWELHGREFANCNCPYGCPCQFSGLPVHGHCRAVVGIQIDRGKHGSTPLDGLRTAAIFRWPGAIHEGGGEVLAIVDKRASAAQRNAILRIMTGEDTDPGATVFSVFASTISKAYDPVFADIDFAVDVEKRRARLVVEGYIDQRGEPLVNPVTKAEARARIDLPGGFEYTIAEIGRGWTKATGPIAYELSDSYGQFAELHLGPHGIIR